MPSPSPRGLGAPPLLRFALLNSVIVFVAAYLAWFQAGIELLWVYDVTHVSFVIAAAVAVVVANLGIRGAAAVKTAHWAAERMTMLGLIGTGIGVMKLMHDVGVHGAADVQSTFAALVLGVSTVVITMLAGLGASLLIDIEIRFLFPDVEEG